MANIRVDLDYTLYDGAEIKFRSPVDCSQVTGLIVYYHGVDGNATSKEFAFADAHGNNVGDIDHLFAENVVVKVILDVTTGMAFVQNADTNAYLEAQLASKRPNTWMPTAADVGAAPSGYGLGGAVLKEWVNIDSIKSPGWYTFSGACVGSFGTLYSPFMRVDAADASHCSQYIYPHGDIALVLTRRITNNVWGEWEWENPPMTANGGYRTRKRYAGSPIYTKYINCGKMPVGTESGPNTVTVNTGVDHSKIVDWRIHIFNGDEYCNLPFISSGEICGDAWLSGSQVHLRSYRDLSTYSVHMVIDYIK